MSLFGDENMEKRGMTAVGVLTDTISSTKWRECHSVSSSFSRRHGIDLSEN